MITERHNIACSLIMKAISKGSLVGCLVHMDTGSTDRLQTVPNWPNSMLKPLQRLKAKKVTHHTILLGVGGSMYTSNTLHHLTELSLDSQRIHKTALICMLTPCIMLTN